jgi:hypothetical protein
VSVPSWARKGVKVVCIKRGRWTTMVPGDVAPSFGDLLTIREVFSEMGEPLLRFVEIENAISRLDRDTGLPSEPAFHASRFRPLVAKKTLAEDVALIKRHLKAPRSSTTQKARADA